MYCLTRDKPIRLPDDDSESDRVLEEIYGLSLDEKADEKELLPTAPSEDEMQDRLKELRKAISGAKLDW